MWVFPSTIKAAKTYYPPDLFENVTKISFCGRMYACCNKYDHFLRTDYGDYMQLPPEAERIWTHHPIIVDFTRNYEDLI